MKKAHQKAKQDIMDQIHEVIEPSKMSPEEALEFLDELASDIEASQGGLRDDIKNAGGQ